MRFIYFITYFITFFMSSVHANSIMPWIYTTNVDCNGLNSRWDYIMEHTEFFSIVAPTVYLLSNNGTDLEINPSGCESKTLEEFSADFPKYNIMVYPHVAYDKVNISSLRDGILGNLTIQDEFLNKLLNKSLKFNYTGYSFDLFPSNDELGFIKKEDGRKYARLVDNFAIKLHKIGKKLRVYTEPGDNFSNIELLSKTNVDLIITQAYEYSIDFGTFITKLYYAITHTNRSKLGIGLCPSCLPHDFTPNAIEYRIRQLIHYNISQLGIWSSGVPDLWLPFLRKFLK